MLRIFRVNKN